MFFPLFDRETKYKAGAYLHQNDKGVLGYGGNFSLDGDETKKNEQPGYDGLQKGLTGSRW